MWYPVECNLKVQIDKIYRFIVVRFICVNDLGKEIEQACHTAPSKEAGKNRETTGLLVILQ